MSGRDEKPSLTQVTPDGGVVSMTRDALNMTPINRCDGCLSGAPMRDGLHTDTGGRVFMACQRDRYAAPNA